MSLDNFLNECKKNDRFTLIIAEPGGGKTFLMLNVLKYYLDNNTFTEYHLVLPAFKNERDGSYDFLKNPKYKKYVFIYNEYHQKISETLYKRQFVTDPKKLFFWIDDSTGEQGLWNDDYITKIATKTRHLRTSFYIICHSDGASIIKPKIRCQAQFLFLGEMHLSVLHNCYKSYVNFKTDFPTFKKFVEYMEREVYSQKYGMFFIDKVNRQYSPDASLWFSDELSNKIRNIHI